jgi:hypothetical protein
LIICTFLKDLIVKFGKWEVDRYLDKNRTVKKELQWFQFYGYALGIRSLTQGVELILESIKLPSLIPSTDKRIKKQNKKTPII